ncbi:MAG TPA: hypothetical protein VNK95_17830 [Caldilineaceae bacterium]|nr:hypothetical protein [Caldilineaceae bacterium]
MISLFSSHIPSWAAASRESLAVVGLALGFIALRLLGFSQSYIWLDDVISVAPYERILERIPWSEFLPAALRYALLEITGPLLPALLHRAIANAVGPNLLLLRLPALAAAALSFWLLYRLLIRLQPGAAARLTPLALFSLSTPAIIYSQAIQPTIFYALSTLLLLYWFVTDPQLARPPSWAVAVERFYRFSYLALLAFLLNYMSVMIYGLLSLYFITRFWANERGRPGAAASTARLAGEMVVAALPLLLFVAVRMLLGEETRRYFVGRYYVESLGDLARLSYDTLSYHFNFAYGLPFYAPLGANWPALPYAAICLLGLGYFIAQAPWRLVPVAGGFFGVALAAALELAPLGGVRHSFTYAPLFFVLVAYAIAGLQRAGRHTLSRPRGRPAQALAAILVMGAALLFAVSGRQVYSLRATSLDLTQLATLAQRQGVTAIAGYDETYGVLAMMETTAGYPLARRGLSLLPFDSAREQRLSYLLVAYRHRLDPPPSWQTLYYRADSAQEKLAGAQVTPLVEKEGGLDPARLPMVTQSIYYPPNGLFVYLVEPEAP